MFMSLQQNAGTKSLYKDNIFENVLKLKYIGTSIARQMFSFTKK
jgi:hypothetical protein